MSETKEYQFEPYGKEWESVLMRESKKDLISRYKDLCKRYIKLKNENKTDEIFNLQEACIKAGTTNIQLQSENQRMRELVKTIQKVATRKTDYIFSNEEAIEWIAQKIQQTLKETG